MRCRHHRPLLVVTSLADSGAGSLRQAIADANACAGDDQVTFAGGLNGTIELASPLEPVTESLWITDPGPAQLTVEQSAIVDNRARLQGGGVWVFGRELISVSSSSGRTLPRWSSLKRPRARRTIDRGESETHAPRCLGLPAGVRLGADGQLARTPE